MRVQSDYRPLGCAECAKGVDLGFDFTMAFQPIVDIRHRRVFAQEALVRGLNGESAYSVFQNVNDSNRYRFDQSCRVKAIKLAAQLKIDTYLSINFLPNAVYRPELCIRTTLNAAEEYGFDTHKIIFEFTENERIDDYVHLKGIVEHYRSQGFLTATDDFGAGYSGLNLLSNMQTDITKLDMLLIRNIDTDPVKQIVVRNLVNTFNELNMRIIAEGVETQAELDILKALGIELFQGYFFAKPSFESLAEIHWGH